MSLITLAAARARADAAYVLAAAALPKAGGTMVGDIVFSGTQAIPTPPNVWETTKYIVPYSLITCDGAAKTLNLCAKAATDRLVGVRMEWGNPKYNHAANFYAGVGRTGDDDAYLLMRDISGVGAGVYTHTVHYNQTGAEYADYGAYIQHLIGGGIGTSEYFVLKYQGATATLTTGTLIVYLTVEKLTKAAVTLS